MREKKSVQVGPIDFFGFLNEMHDLSLCSQRGKRKDGEEAF